MTPDAPSAPSLVLAREVHTLCERFEAALQRGEKASLEDVLPAAGPLREAALVELVKLEIWYRRKAGEVVSLGDYVTRYPHLAHEWDSLMQTNLPDQFGPYTIVKKLGEGGMGTVYEAIEKTKVIERRVALKVPKLQSDADARHRFILEARSAMAVRHDNICPIFNADEWNGVPYLTMPLIEGSTLAVWARERSVPEREAAEIVRVVALAMQVIHAQNLIHRDLKLDNIMLEGPQQKPLIMDFGLARSYQGNVERLTQLGAGGPGTLPYMSPEQLLNDPNRPMGQGCDIYSLGIVLYRLLTGVLPFNGPSLENFMAQILHGSPPPPSQLRPGLNPIFDVICLKALAKNPHDRQRTMAEFADDLAKALQPPVPPSVLPTGITCRLNLIGHTAEVTSVCFSPDGNRLASSSVDHTTKVWDARTGALLFSLPGSFGVCFSHDSKRIATSCDDCTIKVWNAQTGALEVSLAGHTAGVSSICFAPWDASRLASGSFDHTAKLWDTVTGREIFTFRDHKDKVSSVAFFAVAAGIASCDYAGQTHVWSSITGKRYFGGLSMNPPQAITSCSTTPVGQWLAVGSCDGNIVLWGNMTDLVSVAIGNRLDHDPLGQTFYLLPIGVRVLWSVSFRSDTRYLAAGYSVFEGQALGPGEISVWDVHARSRVYNWGAHSGKVTSVAFHPYLKSVASASADRSVRVWDLALPDPPIQPAQPDKKKWWQFWK
jgi:serine/threonine protein kinase